MPTKTKNKQAKVAPQDSKEKAVELILGYPGSMLSGSKSAYSKRHPGNQVFFNANVYNSQATKLWFGDLDLTRDQAKLQALANTLEETVYVTREQPYRFIGMFNDEKLTVERLEADAAEKDYPGVVKFTPEKK